MTIKKENSVLIIGATGKSGLAMARKLAKDSNVAVHAMARNPDKLATMSKLFESIVEGNAHSSSDVENALNETKANWVVISVGNGESVSQSDVRTSNAIATTSVLQKTAFSQVRVIVLSSVGAGLSKIIVGFGIGSLLAFHLRHVLADHNGQEEAFGALGAKRRTIVRATNLTDDAPVGKLVTFGDTDRMPGSKTDRADRADWISDMIIGVKKIPQSGVVNVTGYSSKK